jgi:hypothetical protein
VDASVVDLPLPVVPVTRITPRSSRASVPPTSGKPKSSNFGTLNGMKFMAIETESRCRNVLTWTALLSRLPCRRSPLPPAPGTSPEQRLQHGAPHEAFGVRRLQNLVSLQILEQTMHPDHWRFTTKCRSLPFF